MNAKHKTLTAEFDRLTQALWNATRQKADAKTITAIVVARRNVEAMLDAMEEE